MLVDGPFHTENVCIPCPHPGEPAPNIRATWPPLLTPQQILDEPSRLCCNGSACAARALPTEDLEWTARCNAPSSGSGAQPPVGPWQRAPAPCTSVSLYVEYRERVWHSLPHTHKLCGTEDLLSFSEPGPHL